MLTKLMKIVVFYVPIFFLALFAVCIFVKSDLLFSPATLVSIVVFSGIIFASRHKCGSWIKWLIAIFAFAFIFRVLFLFIWPITPRSDCKTAYDFSLLLSKSAISSWHEVFAGNLYYYEVWPMHIPFVIFQTICLKILGNSVFSIQLVNVLFSAITCVFVALCAEGLTHNKRIGIIAGCLMCLNFTTLFMASFMVNQQVATCFFVVSLYFIIKKPWRSTGLNYVCAGISLGIAHLMRPEMYIVVIAVLCMFIYELLCVCTQNMKLFKSYSVTIVKHIVCFILPFFLVINTTNFVLLNLRWAKNPITESKLTYKLMIGLNQETEGRFKDSDYPLAANDIAVKEILDERLAGPVDTLKLMIKKLCFQFSSYNYWWLQADKGGTLRQFVINNIFEPLTQSYMFLIIGLAVVSSFKILKHSTKEYALLYIIFIGYMCAFALMEVQQRYAYINVPIFTILCSVLFNEKLKKDK